MQRSILSVRSLALSLLIVPLLAYGALVAYVYVIQDRLAYFPIREYRQQPADAGLSATEHTFPSGDGETLHAWYFTPGGDPNAMVVLYCHGNAGNISHNLMSVRQLTALGLRVFTFDYRGFGRSSGQPTEAGLYRDARAAYDYLRDNLDIAPDRIVVFGRSLGGAVALHLASRVPARALIVESSFTSAVALGQSAYWYLPVDWLARQRFESLALLRRTPLRDFAGAPLPLLVIHSRQDAVVPFAHGQALFQHARTSRKTFLEIRGGHNDGFLVSRSDYDLALREFLRFSEPQL